MKRKVEPGKPGEGNEPPASGRKPQGGLSPKDIEAVAEELMAYHARFHDLFGRREQRAWSEFYLRGQLSDLERKTTEPMVLHLKGADRAAVRAVQQFVGEGAWKDDPILERLQELVAEDLGEENASVILDGSGFPKQGTHSVGVARQYCGHLGKLANCQHGVFAAYASSKGHAFLDRRLYMPEDWFDDAHAPLRERYGVPEKLKFTTEPALGLAMVKGLVERGTVPFTWVLADETYGADPKFLDGVAALGKRYFVEVPVSTMVWDGRVEVEPAGKGPMGRPRTYPRVVEGTAPRQEVRQIAAALSERAWRRYAIKEGAKGTIEAEFAVVAVTRSSKGGRPGAEALAVFRRGLEDGKVKVFLTNAPRRAAKRVLARVGGQRWPIETAFEEAKGEVGMDHYEVRTWKGWHHHMTQTFLAHHFLVRMRLRGKKSGADAAPSKAAGSSDSRRGEADARAGHRNRPVSARAQLRSLHVTPGSHRGPASKAPEAA
jgi:SRSO17 transposase